MGYLKFSDDIEPSQEALDWLEKVNALIETEVHEKIVELMLYGSTKIWEPTSEVFGRGEDHSHLIVDQRDASAKDQG